jgi:hypothetical protein
MMGNGRSIRKAAESLGKSDLMLERWSAKHGWVLRAAAYEEHFMLKQLDRTEDLRDSMMQRHRDLLAKMYKVVDSRADDWLEILEQDREIELEDSDVIRLLKEVISLDRLAHGLDGKYTPPGLSRSRDLSSLSDEELARLEELTAKVEGDAR